MKPWLAKLPETEEEVVVSDLRQPDDYPGDDLVDIFDDQEARRAHGPNADYVDYLQSKLPYLNFPEEALTDINALFSYFRKVNELNRPGDDITIIQNELSDFFDKIGFSKISKMELNLSDDIYFYGLFITHVNPNVKFVLTRGDLEWAAENISNFSVFLSAMGHEHIHKLQNEKLHLPTHAEKEVMGYAFNLWPNDVLNYIKTNYPQSIPVDLFYNYPPPWDLEHQIDFALKLLEYYDNIPLHEAIRQRLLRYYILARALFYRLMMIFVNDVRFYKKKAGYRKRLLDMLNKISNSLR